MLHSFQINALLVQQCKIRINLLSSAGFTTSNCVARDFKFSNRSATGV